MRFHKKCWHWLGNSVLDVGHGFLLQDGMLMKLVCCIPYSNQIPILPKEGLKNMHTPFSLCYLCILFFLPSLPSNKAGISPVLSQSSLAFWVTHSPLILIATPGAYTKDIWGNFQHFWTSRWILGDAEHLLGNADSAVPTECRAGTWSRRGQ